jgi:hypothetical protein
MTEIDPQAACQLRVGKARVRPCSHFHSRRANALIPLLPFGLVQEDCIHIYSNCSSGFDADCTRVWPNGRTHLYADIQITMRSMGERPNQWHANADDPYPDCRRP